MPMLDLQKEPISGYWLKFLFNHVLWPIWLPLFEKYILHRISFFYQVCITFLIARLLKFSSISFIGSSSFSYFVLLPMFSCLFFHRVYLFIFQYRAKIVFDDIADFIHNLHLSSRDFLFSPNIRFFWSNV